MFLTNDKCFLFSDMNGASAPEQTHRKFREKWFFNVQLLIKGENDENHLHHIGLQEPDTSIWSCEEQALREIRGFQDPG